MYDVAFVGTGPDPDNPVSGESFAMAYRHAPGYERLDNCRIVACADLVPENAEAFAEHFDINAAHVYEDYGEMVRETEPDIVSVCTPVPTHASIVLDLVEAGVEAVHCEKPMALTWGDAKAMAREAWRADVQLTFNHQRRFTYPFRDAKERIEAGDIGELERVEVSCGELLDNGTHFIDLANFYNDDHAAEWVIGQIDYREEQVKYGAHNENHGLVQWAYENGVQGLAATGDGADLVGVQTRAVGTDGEIRAQATWRDGPSLRIRRGDDWETIEKETEETGAIEGAIEHLVACLDSGTEPEISARQALSQTELIFGAYESSRRRGRVEFPLDVEDNPLEAMVESGELNPEPEA